MVTLRPIYQWKSFWLGVVVLLCLGWGWQQAMRMDQWVNVTTPVMTFGASQWNGRAGMHVNSARQGWGVSTNARLRKGGADWFPWAMDADVAKRGKAPNREWQVYARFAHWFLILVFVTVWWAWLARQWKRERMRIA